MCLGAKYCHDMLPFKNIYICPEDHTHTHTHTSTGTHIYMLTYLWKDSEKQVAFQDRNWNGGPG